MLWADTGEALGLERATAMPRAAGGSISAVGANRRTTLPYEEGGVPDPHEALGQPELGFEERFERLTGQAIGLRVVLELDPSLVRADLTALPFFILAQNQDTYKTNTL
jgi:hypothetical protein